MFDDMALIPDQASTVAERVDNLFWFLFSVCGAVGLLVAVLLIYFSVRYRQRSGETGPPAETPSSLALEWFWTITPCFPFAIMFLWGASVYLEAFHAPPDAMPVYVVAKQWMWKFQHARGQRAINVLHVPVGRPVKLVLTSEDVIHSLFIPAFRIHMDVLPERYTTVWFQATRPGTWHLFCSQYCGTESCGHDRQRRRSGAGRLSALARVPGRGLAGAGRAQGLSEIPLRELPQRRLGSPGARVGAPLRKTSVAARRPGRAGGRELPA